MDRLINTVIIKHVTLDNHNYDNTEDYLFLHKSYSVKKHMHQQTFNAGLLMIICLASFVLLIHEFLLVSSFLIISASIASFYLFVSLFKLFVTFISLKEKFISFSSEEISAISDEELPLMTILIPLYNEALVIPQILDSMNKIDYPKNKLELLITLEEYDKDTIEALNKHNLPDHFKLVILPNVQPKTKPKALNVAFRQVKGKYLVIYDAEVIPEPLQLKKAYLAFKKDTHLGGVQTRLDHYNSHQNLITKLFNAEFSFYYDLYLPGLQKLDIPIPLSGHSVIFHSEVLKRAGAWDPYNVAEDCDVGIRLQRIGYKIGILDSVSREEATSTITSWIRQRTRWMKGFIQTSIVHLRHPLAFKKELGSWKRFFGFLLIVPGTVIINLFNFIYWIMLVAWLLFQPSAIQKFFPGFILYFSFFAFVIGNFVFTYLNLLGVHKRQRYGLVKYTILTPMYWLLLSISTIRAVIQLFIKPHHWEKTHHGKHLNKVNMGAM